MVTAIITYICYCVRSLFLQTFIHLLITATLEAGHWHNDPIAKGYRDKAGLELKYCKIKAVTLVAGEKKGVFVLQKTQGTGSD